MRKMTSIILMKGVYIISDMNNKNMRTAFLRITAINHTTKDNDKLGVKAGEVFEYTLEDILNIIDTWLKSKKFIYFVIEHSNTDENGNETNKHWHIVIAFSNKSSCKFKTIKNKFPYGDIETCRTGVKNCVRYIVHVDKPEKKQYNWDDIITNAPDKLEMYKIPGKISINYETSIIIKRIADGDIKEYETEKISPEIYAKKHTQIINAFKYRRQMLLKDPTRNVKIYVLMGKTRLGKSTYARVWAEKHGKSIFFSSGGNDFFGEYLGQDIACLDDFDYENVSINDFKKIIDPYVNGTIPSRYHNKLFVGDTIFICTNQPITDWFPYDDDADRAAIFERISFVLDFKSYDELSDNEDLSLLNNRKLPEYSEGTSYYTVNKIAPTNSYKNVKDKHGFTVNRYREWKLQPIEETIRSFILTKYIDINNDKLKCEDFLKQIDEI